MLLDNQANYRKDTLQRRIMSATLGNGLLLAEQEQWRIQRRTLAPIFALRNVMAWAPGMHDAAHALVERWRSEPADAIVDVAAEVTLLTLDILERTIFSDGLGGDPDEVRAAWRTYFDTVGRIEPLDLLGLPEFVPRFGRLKARSALRVFGDAVDAIIETRRERLRDDPTKVPHDLLTLLLEAEDPETGAGLSEIEIRGNIVTFIAAGHETTANTITWSLFLLSQSQEWRARVTAEARREIGGPVEGLAQRLVATRAVIDEAIRLYPPLSAISRAAIDRDELAGQEIKPGSMVVIAPYLVHRHRALWDRPDCFDPTRFLDKARDAIPRFAYLPFGLGPRTCIGSSFALQAATLAVAAIMGNFELGTRSRQKGMADAEGHAQAGGWPADALAPASRESRDGRKPSFRQSSWGGVAVARPRLHPLGVLIGEEGLRQNAGERRSAACPSSR